MAVLYYSKLKDRAKFSSTVAVVYMPFFFCRSQNSHKYHRVKAMNILTIRQVHKPQHKPASVAFGVSSEFCEMFVRLFQKPNMFLEVINTGGKLLRLS